MYLILCCPLTAVAHNTTYSCLFPQTEFYNNYLRDLDRPGQQEITVTTPILPPSSSSGSPSGIVHLDERPAISPGGPSTPGGWGQPPPMMFPRGLWVYSYICICLHMQCKVSLPNA